MRKPSPLLPLLFVALILNLPFMTGLVQVRGDVAEMSPGKILPQGRNLYLDETNETQVKVEFSKGIVLQETLGDLLFNVTTYARRRTIAVYIPPEFKVSQDLTYVWTSVTNDYRYISLSTLSNRDPIAPNWQRILVSNGTGGITSGSHFIRVFNVTAPSIVGQYFFKIYVDGASIGTKNFPTLIVSADPNPAYISGTVLDGDPLRYGEPVGLEGLEGGRVVAEGITPEGRIIIAQAFFNASAKGRYTLYGLATGTYSLTASAAGYYNTTRPDSVIVVSGQSLENVTVYVYPSPKIQGTVWSKCGGMPHTWDSISVHSGPYEGASLTYVETGIFQGCIYALRGGDTSDFLQYDSSSDRWETKRHTPGSIGPGGSLVFGVVEGVEYIYMLQGGGSNAFWRYNVVNDEWQAMKPTPGIVGDGAALTFNPKDYKIYAIAGGETNNFWCYTPENDEWEVLPHTLKEVGAGGALASDAKGRLYAFRGMGETDFWCYDPSTRTWAALSTGPTVASGASLVFGVVEGVEYIYMLQGGGSNAFWRYDITADSWSSLSNLSVNVGPGGALTFGNGKIYALVGGGLTSENFYVYDVSSNLWEEMSDFPCVSPRPISIEILDAMGDSKYVLQNYTDPYSDRFDFTYEGLTGFDGHIPQDGAGYVSGISPGSYIVEVWVNQYIQPDTVQLPGTYEEITGVWVELSGHTTVMTVQLEVQRTGIAEILAHFRDPRSKALTPVESDRILTVALYDHNRDLRAQNSTRVKAGSTSSLVVLTGFLGTLRDYGLPADTYLIGVTVTGFYQASDAFITLSVCGAKGEMSLDVFKSGSLIITVRSVDSQRPPVPRYWRYPGSSIRVEVRDRYGAEVVASNTTRQQPFSQSVNLSITGLRTGVYSIYVFTFGYVQPDYYMVSVVDGAVTDMAVNVVVGGELELIVILEKEDMLTTVDTYPFSSNIPVRVQVLNAYNQFTAANITHISSNQNIFTIRLAGFRNYAGSYSEQRWANYYDTTDGAQQRDYGLPAGSYSFLVYIPGFAQHDAIVAALPQQGVSSVILHLDRLAHLYGHVSSFNKFDERVPLNWVTVDAIVEQTSGFTSTLDGCFDIWLEEGRYLIILSLNGYATVFQEVSLPEGSDVTINFYISLFP